MVWIDAIEITDYLVLVFLSPRKGKTEQKSNFFERFALSVAIKRLLTTVIKGSVLIK